MKRALIIGGGIGGCIGAIELSKKKWNVTIAEASTALGSGLRTMRIGGHPCTLGPRHFLTHNQSTFDYLNSLVKLRRCQEHQFISYIEEDRQFYNYPIHVDDIPSMPEASKINFELSSLDKLYKDREFKLTTGSETPDSLLADNYKDFWVKSIGPTLYEKFISKYTRKMWQVEDETIIDDLTWSPKGVAIKSGPREGWDSAISAYPEGIDGYDPVFDHARLVSNVRYSTTAQIIDPKRGTASLNGAAESFDLILNTAPLDTAFGGAFGELKYIGRDIDYIVLPVAQVLPDNVYFSYYCGNQAYTRVVEYKKFTRFESGQTLISIEKPSRNGRYYPLPISSEKMRAAQYLSLCNDRVFSIGRLGRYNYRFDIDDAVEQALEVVGLF